MYELYCGLTTNIVTTISSNFMSAQEFVLQAIKVYSIESVSCSYASRIESREVYTQYTRSHINIIAAISISIITAIIEY